MKILAVVQGSAEWLALRAQRGRRCASDAPVIMGESPHLRRSDLMRMKSTGDEREFSAWERDFLLAKGHEVEALARPLLEEDLGDEFYPVTATDDDGLHLSSYDGLTMGSEDAFEHKLWNAELAAAIAAGDPTPLVYWQLEHQFITGKGKLKRIHLVCSDGTRDRWAYMVYTPVKGRAKQLLAAWEIFEQDVATYQHVEVLPKATPDVIVTLPALSVNVSGAITVHSNLERFGEAMAEFIAKLPEDPRTDQDFANAENGCKVLATAETALKAAEANALAQTETVDQLRTLVSTLVKTARDTRLRYEKVVEAKKASIRDEIRRDGLAAVDAHTATLNTQLGGRYLPAIPYDLAGAMKGKKTIASLRDAVSNEVMRFKIKANEIAGTITTNLRHLSEHAAGSGGLFPDLASLAVKEPEHFALVVKSRLDEETRRVEALAETAREKIRAEEQAKAIAEVTRAAPTPIGVPAPARTATLAVVPAPAASPRRPTDDQIIEVLAMHFRAHESQVIAWLLEVDLAAAGHRMVAAEFK